MSLQVWLPLKGDLHNQGVNRNIIATAIGTLTYDNNGKIGKCYQRATTNAQSLNGIQLNTNFLNIFNTTASVAMWVKPLGTHTHYNGTLLSSGDWNQKCWAFGVSQDNTKVDVLCGSYNRFIDCAVPVNEWTHLCSTFDNGTCKIYKNGIYVGSLTGQSNFNSDATTTCVGRETYANGYFGFNGLINDVRIYDHCLSQKEVEEISKGLVLHYKLDNNGMGNENLVTGSNTNSTSTNKWGAGSAVGGNSSTIEQDSTGVYCVKITRDNTAQSSWDYLYYERLLRDKIKTNTKYTVSFDCKPSVDGSISFSGFANGNATNYMTNSTTTIQGNCKANQWNHMVYQCTTLSSFNDISITQQLVYFLRSASLKGTNVTVLFKNIKVEEGTIETPWCPAIIDSLYTSLNGNLNVVYDSSGYNNNGTIVGALETATPSPKYSCATHIPATSSKIHISNFLTSGFSNSYSFAWWGKRNSNGPMFWGFSDGIRLNGMYLGNLWNTGDGSNNPLYKIGTTTQVSAPSVNVWHHYVMVGNGSKCYVYLDGELWAEAKTYKAISGTSIYINGWDAGTSYCSDNTDISDFRVYATALTEAQIKELYRTSMIVSGTSVIARDLE